jgi:aldose sugar dehydrogenase
MTKSLFFDTVRAFRAYIDRLPLKNAARIAAAFTAFCAGSLGAQAQTLVDSNLSIRVVATNLEAPTTMAFLGSNDFLILEKNSGRVRRVMDGIVQTNPVLDLVVNSASERGLLGIALHPDFPNNPGVYLRWTQSSSNADSGSLADVPLLGNRVDRFVWNGSTLAFDRNIIQLRAFQADAGQPLRGNHNGGPISFGPDRKLYIYFGDNGRRGQMQNLPDGPGCTNPPCADIPSGNLPDDQFGGPEPDNAHLAGVVLRLNDDGSAPRDNPFYRAGANRGGEAGANLQKVFAYGIRNGFGMAFDPLSGNLWEAQNGDDSFTEINLVDSGANLGWVQIMGPLSRLEQFKAIETSSNFFGLQQLRWPPTNIADSQDEAFSRLFWIYENGDEFGALLTGGEENPKVETSARATAEFDLKDNRLEFELKAAGSIDSAIAAHIHLGARGQNGPIVAFLFESASPTDFERGDRISKGKLRDADIIARPGFTPTVANLAERIRQGRAYVNLHTVAHPAGEIRGQAMVLDEKPVSHYSNPEFSWKFEVAPAGLGFINSGALGGSYRGDMIVGAARDFLQGGTLFHFDLSGGRREIRVEDPRLADKVADNTNKFDITESESLLFGTGFGIGTDIQTGPNGNLYVVSLTKGAVYEISRKPGVPAGSDENDPGENQQ